MALDAAGKSGGIAVLWLPHVVELSNWSANKFSLLEYFHHLVSGVKGTLVYIYGPSSFPEK